MSVKMTATAASIALHSLKRKVKRRMGFGALILTAAICPPSPSLCIYFCTCFSYSCFLSLLLNLPCQLTIVIACRSVSQTITRTACLQVCNEGVNGRVVALKCWVDVEVLVQRVRHFCTQSLALLACRGAGWRFAHMSISGSGSRGCSARGPPRWRGGCCSCCSCCCWSRHVLRQLGHTVWGHQYFPCC